MSKEQTFTRRDFFKKTAAFVAPSLPLANAVLEMRKSDQILESIPEKLSTYSNVQSPAIDESRATLREELRDEAEKHATNAVVSSIITSAIVTGEILLFTKQKYDNQAEEKSAQETLTYPSEKPNAA